MTADEFEIWFDKGVTDGLPVVPPMRERVERMLAAHGYDPNASVGMLMPSCTDATWQSIVAADIGAGTLSGVLVWNEVCTASPCTLANTPRTADTLLAFWRTTKLRRVAACGGIGDSGE